MSENANAKSPWMQYLICYSSLVVMTVLSFLLLPGLVRSISHIGLLLGANRYIMTALNQWSFVLLGLLWLITFFWVEHYLRAGIHAGTLWRRIGRILAGEAALLALIYLIQKIPLA